MQIDKSIADPSVADELEFTSWPIEHQRLAMRVLKDAIDIRSYDAGYDDAEDGKSNRYD